VRATWRGWRARARAGGSWKGSADCWKANPLDRLRRRDGTALSARSFSITVLAGYLNARRAKPLRADRFRTPLSLVFAYHARSRAQHARRGKEAEGGFASHCVRAAGSGHSLVDPLGPSADGRKLGLALALDWARLGRPSTVASNPRCATRWRGPGGTDTLRPLRMTRRCLWPEGLCRVLVGWSPPDYSYQAPTAGLYVVRVEGAREGR
jgi:hypothetical protein